MPNTLHISVYSECKTTIIFASNFHICFCIEVWQNFSHVLQLHPSANWGYVIIIIAYFGCVKLTILNGICVLFSWQISSWHFPLCIWKRIGVGIIKLFAILTFLRYQQTVWLVRASHTCWRGCDSDHNLNAISILLWLRHMKRWRESFETAFT